MDRLSDSKNLFSERETELRPMFEEERRLTELRNAKMQQVSQLQQELDQLRDSINLFSERETELRPLFEAKARQFQVLWAETRAVSTELEALLRRQIGQIRQEMNDRKQREP